MGAEAVVGAAIATVEAATGFAVASPGEAPLNAAVGSSSRFGSSAELDGGITVDGTAAVGTAFALRLKPHWPQKVAFSCTDAPHCGQAIASGRGV